MAAIKKSKEGNEIDILVPLKIIKKSMKFILSPNLNHSNC